MDDRTNMALERIAGLTVKQSAFLMEYAKTENLSQADVYKRQASGHADLTV